MDTLANGRHRRKAIIAKLTALLVPSLLWACAQATPITKPVDGRQQYIIECNGAYMPFSAYFKKADEFCSGGYDIVDEHRSAAQLFVAIRHGRHPLSSALAVDTRCASAAS